MPVRSLAATVLLCVTALALTVTQAFGGNPGSGTTSAGQPLSIRIDAPANGATVPAANLAVSGVAGIGALTGAGQTNVMYILDNSGSTSSSVGDCNGDGAVDANDDANADGAVGTVLDCEIGGIVALNRSLAGSGALAGIVAFGSAADGADMAPAPGQQDFTGVSDDANGNGVADVEDVARSIGTSGPALFTAYTTSGGGTDFDAALARMNTALAPHAGQRNIAAFLSDGQSSVDTAAGAALDQARAAGVRINTFSVGTAAAGCATGSSLRTISDTTGGTCTEVTDPSKLSGTISGAVGSGLQAVQITVGSTKVPATLTPLGAWSATVPASALAAGANRVVATVTASDGTTASADVTVNVGGKLTGASVIGMPSARRCTSKRMFPIRIRQVAGVRYDFAQVYVNGKRTKVYVKKVKRWVRVNRVSAKLLNVKRFQAAVDLRGLPKGRYKVRIVVVTSSGKVLTNTRRYRTCAAKLKGSVPKL
jgi:hypothetical protein